MDWTRVCFVVSPIGQRGTENYEIFRRVLDTLIRPAVERSALRLRVIRADEIHQPGSFIRDVVEYIANAHTVIVDLTGQNANVFYELGVRHALSPRTILIARSESDIPADLREYRTLIYGNMADAGAELPDTLGKYLKAIERRPDQPDNPVLTWLRPPQIPDDLRQTFSARLADAGSTQAEILRFVRNRTRRPGQRVSQSAINEHFRKRSVSEIYYRLEHLRLLGFIAKHRDPERSSDEYSYALSPDYRAELGLPDEPPAPELALLNKMAEKEPFGTGPDAPPAYFVYLRVMNPRDARVENVRLVLSRIQRFSSTGSILDDYQSTMALKWRYGSDRERRLPRSLEPRSVTIANFGFAVRGYGFFQLDIAEDPWPPGFPARVDPSQRIRVNIVAEGDDVPPTEPVQLEVSWDGEWQDDAAGMQQHLVVREVGAD
jgi:hypothetical protein